MVSRPAWREACCGQPCSPVQPEISRKLTSNPSGSDVRPVQLDSSRVPTFSSLGSDSIALLLEQLMSCPNNQFAMYVEMSAPVIDAENKERFRQLIEKRSAELERESAKKRVAKVLKKLT